MMIATKEAAGKIIKREKFSQPFSAKIGFDTIADLTRQPSWSSWLRSVTYITSEDDKKNGRRGRRYM